MKQDYCPSRFFKSYLKDTTGNVAMLYALVALPLFLAAGAAIDMARFNSTQTDLQSALDTGALAGAGLNLKTDADRIAAAKAMFDVNLANNAASEYTVSVTYKIEDGKVKSDATVKVPMAFMQMAGIDTMDAVAKAEVSLSGAKKAEVVLVLDYSGSMGEVSGKEVKYVAMKNAATKLVNELSSTASGNLKIGLVPFSHHVYTTLPSEYVVGGSGAGSWTGCTQDRQYPHNVSNNTPTSDVGSKWNQPQAPIHLYQGCQGYVDNSLQVLDLTDNFTTIKNQLSIMKPYAWTHIAVGVEFGYHMLSPDAPFTQGVSFKDDKTEKFMVVLTDGMQTEPAFGPGKSRDVAQGESNLETLCKSAKKDDITIITMAFDLDDGATRKRLENCSTDPLKHFFIANDDADVANAFESVKQAITAEVYLSR